MKIRSQQKKQQGVALVVSLIILVSLTMLGMTSIQRTTTDLSMAGNQRETGLMFQSAEVGLAAAENLIEASNTNGDFDDSNGLFTVVANDANYKTPAYFNATTWGANASQASGAAGASITSDFGLKIEPRFIVEYLGDRAQNALANVNIGGYGTQQTGEIVSIYRSTARGTGLTGNSFRYVQSYYGKEAP